LDHILIDYVPNDKGWHVSLLRLAGMTVDRDDSMELNVLELDSGIDVDDRSLRSPGFGQSPQNRLDIKSTLK
jgi:hypothetical protein